MQNSVQGAGTCHQREAYGCDPPSLLHLPLHSWVVIWLDLSLAALHGAPVANRGEMFQLWWDTEDAPGMPVTNLPPFQGDFLHHHAGPQRATSSHPGLPGHRGKEEEKHCRHGSSHGGEGVKGLAMRSLGVPQEGQWRLPAPSSGSKGLHQAKSLPSATDQLVQTLFHICSLMQGER